MPIIREILQTQIATEEMGLFWQFYTTVWSITWLIGLVCFVFESISLYAIAKRRRIRRPWLSWIPICNLWILGSISDQYQYVVKRRVRNRRKVLLATGIVTTLLGIAIAAAAIFLIVDSIVALSGAYLSDAWFMNLALTLSLLSLLMTGFAVWHVVYTYMAYYDVFSSCDPDTKTVFLVVGIIFQMVVPFFLFADRNRDNGMPPRTDDPYLPPEQ